MEKKRIILIIVDFFIAVLATSTFTYRFTQSKLCVAFMYLEYPYANSLPPIVTLFNDICIV